MAAFKDFSWMDDELDLFHCPGVIQDNLTRENLLLLVLFVISFSISKSCIFVVFFSDLKPFNS